MGQVGLTPDLSKLAEEYDLLRELGRGGMAAVYLARDRALDRDVAIKVIRAAYAQDDEVVARFAREARLLAKLDHPNIVRIYAVRRLADQSVALVMQHVPGPTLRQTVGIAGQLPVELVLSVLRDVGAALQYAHGRGVVHRDVKPENIFLQSGTARALLSDFGVAHSMESDSFVTIAGSAIGTPTYMSPEQIEGVAVDGRSDLYALAVVAWEMLSGKRLWEGDGIYTVLYKHKHENLPSLAELRDDIPEQLLMAIEGALRKDRDERWPSVEDFLRRLPDRDALLAAELETPRNEMSPEPTTPADDTPTVRFRRPPPVADARQAEPAAAVPATAWEPDIMVEPPPAVATSGSRLRLLFPFALTALAATAIAGAIADRRAAALHRGSDSLATATRAGALAPVTKDTNGNAKPTPNRTVPSSTSRPASRRAAPARTHADSLALCQSPRAAAQRACLYAHLAESDVELNRVYGALIAELRRRAGPPRSATEPLTVQRLREAQRAWIVERDTTCRRRTRASEGPLWAPVRARCLGELSALRAQKLSYELLKLRTTAN